MRIWRRSNYDVLVPDGHLGDLGPPVVLGASQRDRRDALGLLAKLFQLQIPGFQCEAQIFPFEYWNDPASLGNMLFSVSEVFAVVRVLHSNRNLFISMISVWVLFDLGCGRFLT